MGKNYYLSKGYYLDDFRNVQLTEIFKDMKSIEEIDMYTSKFNDFDALRSELLDKELIHSSEGIVIGCYKTDKETKVKRLVPIFQRKMIFKKDLKNLGFKGTNYSEIAKEIKDYVFERSNNFEFMSYIIEQYYQKYSNSKSKVKAPIYESGDISILNRIVTNRIKETELMEKLLDACKENEIITEKVLEIYNGIDREISKKAAFEKLLFFVKRSSLDLDMKNYLETIINTIIVRTYDNDKKEYSVSFRNFFMNEIYKCERVYEPFTFNGVDRENIMMFKPIDYKVNNKGLHDLLCHIIDYAMQYEICYEDEYEFTDEKKDSYEQISFDYDNEEFLEERDFERPLHEYANEVDLDLLDSEAVEKDDYASSFIIDQHRLVKKYDGME